STEPGLQADSLFISPKSPLRDSCRLAVKALLQLPCLSMGCPWIVGSGCPFALRLKYFHPSLNCRHSRVFTLLRALTLDKARSSGVPKCYKGAGTGSEGHDPQIRVGKRRRVSRSQRSQPGCQGATRDA